MTRDAFVARVRDALHRAEGAPTESPPTLLAPLAEWDPQALVDGFVRELEAVGAHVHLVDTANEAQQALQQRLSELGASSLVHSNESIVKDVMGDIALPVADDIADADVGITGATFGIADTGTLVLTSDAGRLASLLPMTHIALLRASQLVPSMSEAIEAYGKPLPAAWVQATGMSRTADIEQTLAEGVHGPGVVHVVLIEGE